MPVTCEVCEKTLSCPSNLNRHRNEVHGLMSNIVSSNSGAWKCLEKDCHTSFRRNIDIVNHLQEIHNKEVEIEEIQFSNLQEFQSWKSQVENNEKCKYIHLHGSRFNKDGNEVVSYTCNHNGKLDGKSSGIGEEGKSQRSCKMGSSCISKINLIKSVDQIIGTRIKTHYGHEVGLKHLKIKEIDGNRTAVYLNDHLPRNTLNVAHNINDKQQPEELSNFDRKKLEKEIKDTLLQICVKISTTHFEDSVLEQIIFQLDCIKDLLNKKPESIMSDPNARSTSNRPEQVKFPSRKRKYVSSRKRKYSEDYFKEPTESEKIKIRALLLFGRHNDHDYFY